MLEITDGGSQAPDPGPMVERWFQPAGSPPSSGGVGGAAHPRVRVKPRKGLL